MKSALVTQLRELDPARQLPRRLASADDPQLRALLAEPRTVESGPDRQPARRHIRLAVAAAGAVAVAAAVAITMVAPWSTPPAFASWTPVPTQLSPDQIEQRIAECPDRYPNPPDSPTVHDGPLDLALADVRGEYTMTIFADNQVFVQCYVHTDPAGAVLASTAQAGQVRHTPMTSGLSTISNGITIWNFGPDDGGAVALAYGLAGPDVTAVTATMTDGRTIAATVAGGWWAMWSPGDTPLPEQVRVDYADNSSATVTARQPS